MNARRLSPLAALLFGCASSTPSAPPPPVVAIAPPAPPPAETASDPEPPSPLPPSLDGIDGDVACQLTASAWTNGSIPLRFRAGASPYITVSNGTLVTLALPVGAPSQGGFMGIKSGGVTVFGVIHGDDFVLRPRKAQVIQGFLVPLPNARLLWRGGAKGALTTALALDPRVRPAAPITLPPRSCDDVSLEETSFDTDALTGSKGTERQAKLKKDRPIPLSITAGGPKVADLVLEKDDDEIALVTAQKGGAARVVWAAQEAMVFGWVPSATIELLPNDLVGDMYGYGGLGTTGAGEEGGTRIVCTGGIRLIFEVGGEQRTTGVIDPGTAFIVHRAKGKLWPAELLSSAITVEGGTKLFVREVDVAACKTPEGAAPTWR